MGIKIGICEMCGSEDRLYKAEIEGTKLNVCQKCAKFGKVLANVQDRKVIEKMQKKREKEEKTRAITKQPISKNELMEMIVEDFAEIIKKKREALGLKQDDFAKQINEKVSLIHKLETGSFEPNIALARKIEKFLKVKLVEQQESSTADLEKTQTEEFTLGDFIKVRKRE